MQKVPPSEKLRKEIEGILAGNISEVSFPLLDYLRIYRYTSRIEIPIFTVA